MEGWLTLRRRSLRPSVGRLGPMRNKPETRARFMRLIASTCGQLKYNADNGGRRRGGGVPHRRQGRCRPGWVWAHRPAGMTI